MEDNGGCTRRQVDDINRVLRSGAEKVSVNTGAVGRPRLFTEAAEGGAGTPPASASPPTSTEAQPAVPAAASSRDLKAEAMSSSAVQAMLDVFPAEIRDVEEM